MRSGVWSQLWSPCWDRSHGFLSLSLCGSHKNCLVKVLGPFQKIDYLLISDFSRYQFTQDTDPASWLVSLCATAQHESHWGSRRCMKRRPCMSGVEGCHLDLGRNKKDKIMNGFWALRLRKRTEELMWKAGWIGPKTHVENPMTILYSLLQTKKTLRWGEWMVIVKEEYKKMWKRRFSLDNHT